MVDLEEAISVARHAVEATPNDHPDRALCLNNLGTRLGSRYERTGAIADLKQAIGVARQAVEAIPDDRPSRAACLNNLGYKLGGRYERTEAMADLEEAFNCFRQTWKLATAVPCQRIFAVVRSLLHEFGPAVEREQLNSRRRQAILDFEPCLREIRMKPGHERFMMGLTTAEMRHCAAGGTIVVVNVSSFRSDAIIITPTVIKAVPLTKLSVSDAQKWLGREWSTKKAQRAKSNSEYLAYLAWLWESCVEQVLNDVRVLQGVHGSELLRVWWVGSGLASSMPFHAAGKHRRGSTATAYYGAISSYAPSIKTLAHARRWVDTSQTSGSLLLMTVPTTPAKEGEKAPPDLPGVDAEKDVLLGVTKGYLAAEHVEGPSVDDVLGALPCCSVAYFACHGSLDPVDPSQSGLILQRPRDAVSERAGGAGLVQDRLSVGRISEVSLRNARLAYLSACSTAQNKSDRLSDEVIHVVSGFQVAGFPHVVGCLWPSNDRTCVDVASRFYSRLFGQESPWRDGTAASSLRDAVMGVMEDGELEAPLNWAPYVHYGP